MDEQTVQATQENQPKMPKFRRTVGTRETVGLIAFETANGIPFRLGEHQEWLDRTLGIDLNLQFIARFIIGFGDIINDTFLAVLIEKIRTRWGKFKPLLAVFPFLSIPVTIIMSLLPVIFWGTPSTLMAKFVSWVVTRLLADISNTVWNIASVGMLANVTPDPQERLSLITKARFLSMLNGPVGLIRDILRDVISNRNITLYPNVSRATQVAAETARELSLRRMFGIFGVVTMVAGGLFGWYFAMVSKERVMGSANIAKQEKPPTFRESMRAIKGNRPLLMIVLHEILDGVRVNDQMGRYTSSILNFSNFGTVYGIPGSIINPFSYAYVTKLRARFSTKFLWVAGRNLNRPLQLIIYFVGMLPAGPRSSPGERYTYHRLYAHFIPMVIAHGISDMVRQSTWGVQVVIPEEIRNETIDYGEWKNGFRSEAVVGMLRGVPGKLAGMFGGAVTDFIMARVGFQTGEDFLDQPPEVADWIWRMTHLIPVLFALLAVIPQLFYNIGTKEREVMYAELTERRHAALEAQKAFAREAEEFEQGEE